MSNLGQDFEDLLPKQPEEPNESDCCGSGCSTCVFDIYRQQLSEWEKTCREIKAGRQQNVSNSITRPSLSQIKYSPFQLISIEKCTHDTNMYTFQAVAPRNFREESSNPSNEDDTLVNTPLHLMMGQHLIMKANPDVLTREGSTVNISRAYTPISSGESGRFKVLIKLYADGEMSQYIRTLTVTDTVDWRGPYGSFSYNANMYKYLLMLCAGTGIAPMYPIAKSIVEDESEETLVKLVFACRRFEDILLRDELRQLASYWNFKFEFYLSAEVEDGGARYGETFTKGRITREAVMKELKGKMLENVLVLICGPESFNEDMFNFVKLANMEEKNVFLF